WWALLGGGGEGLGNAVAAGVDDEGTAGLTAADQIGQTARLFVEDLLKDHRRLFYPRPPTALVLLGLLPLSLRLLDDLVGEEGRDLFIVRELHRVAAPPAGHRAQARLIGQ